MKTTMFAFALTGFAGAARALAPVAAADQAVTPEFTVPPALMAETAIVAPTPPASWVQLAEVRHDGQQEDSGNHGAGHDAGDDDGAGHDAGDDHGHDSGHDSGHDNGHDSGHDSGAGHGGDGAGEGDGGEGGEGEGEGDGGDD